MEKNPVTIFLSYEDSDREYRDTLLKHLALMIRQNQISVWDNENILFGENVNEQIAENIHKADIAILLLSSDYFASEKIQEHEFPVLLEKNRQNEMTIIPVLIRPVFYEPSDLASLQHLPRNGQAISQWQNLDEAWIGIVRDISKLIDREQIKKVDKNLISDNDNENLQDLILKNKLNEALKMMALIAAEKNDSAMRNIVFQIQARLNKLNSDSMAGIISYDEERLERNKINYSILNLIEKI